MDAVEIKIPLPHMTLGARAWGPEDGKPVLALHGWLDNAATFDLIAPLLKGVRLVCLDTPGHGLSDHRPPGVFYHFIDNITEVMLAADWLGWDKFNLMGHSMGAGLATLAAGSFPDRIERLALIEGIGPMSNQAKDAPGLIKEAHEHMAALAGKTPPRYKNPEQALKARMTSFPLAESGARILVNRGLKKSGDIWEWTSDPRLTLRSRLRLTEDQVRAFLSEIACPTMLLLGESSQARKMAIITERQPFVSQLDVRTLPGGHHLHLEHPEEVAEAFNEFLQ